MPRIDESMNGLQALGVFQQTIAVGNLERARFEEIDAIVDTGASFTTIPVSVLQRLGVTPHERRAFTIADGSSIDRDLGYAWVRV